MASLHITNTTGCSLSFTCSSPSTTEWTTLDHESKTTVFISGPEKQAKRPKTCLVARPLGHLDEKASQSNNGSVISWMFVIRRPRSLRSKGSWYAVYPACQHIGPCSSRPRGGYRKCREDSPWNVYILHVSCSPILPDLRPITRLTDKKREPRTLSSCSGPVFLPVGNRRRETAVRCRIARYVLANGCGKECFNSLDFAQAPMTGSYR
jgi:hypothetical protein